MQLFTKTLRKALLMVGVLLVVTMAAHAQRTITGTVQDQETGELLIGVTLVEKENRSNGTVTDVEGKFSIRVSNTATALIANYTGYQEQEVPVAGLNTVAIQLGTNAQLQEVIVIGYGTVKREDATGSLQSVSSDKFNRGAITSPQELLAGKVAGVAITTDGSPGGGSRIRIRGESSLSASNDPLIVIDGVPLDNVGVNGSRNFLNLINPDDIESFTVLKDASAAAIYGNRASGGVIIITTKKGALGKKISVGYNVNVSSGETFNRVDVLDAAEYREAIRNNYASDHPALKLLGDANTDWQDEIYQKAFGQDHSLNVSGGIGNMPYRVSLGYTNKDGLLRTDNFKRYTGSVNLNPKYLNNRLQVNVNFKGMLSDNYFANRGAIGAALSFDPTQAIYSDTTDAYGGYTTWIAAGNSGNPNGLAPANPVALLELRADQSTVKHIVTGASADYRFARLPELRYNLNIAYERSEGEGTVIVPDFASFNFDPINGGGLNNRYGQTRTNRLLETYFNYKKEFGKHGLEAVAGYGYQHFKNSSTADNSNTSGTQAPPTIIDASERFLISAFGRLNYTFDDLILFTLTFRRDGSSIFAPEYRWGNFPAAALAIKIAENDNRFLNNIKVRASYGITGQQSIGDDYAYKARYQFSNINALYQLGNGFDTILRPNGYVYDIRWEKTATANAGLDVSVVRDRASFSLDFYQRNTRDLLNFIAFPALSNLTNFATDNVGSMRSRGVELSMNFTPILTKKVRWEFSANVAHNKSKITKLLTNEDPNFMGVATGGIAGGVGSNIQIHSVGYAPSAFYVYEQVYDENGNIKENEFVDQNDDGIINNMDKYRLRQPAPINTWGFTSNLNIGGFDFSFAGRAYQGNYVYNNVQTDMGYLNRLYQSTNYLQNVHQSAVDLNVKSQASLTFSDHFVKNASFFRFDHFTAGYNFRSLVGKDLRLYSTVQNPVVFTKYDGLDPEIGNGIDNSTYPRPRTYLVGLSVKF